MARIVIDARESGTSTGRYIDKLIEYLHGLKPTDEIVVLAKPHRVRVLQDLAPNFIVKPSPYREFTFREQIHLAWQLYWLRADLVHFTMTQQPLLYFKKSITGILDLTTLKFKDPTKNPIIFTVKQWVYKVVVWWAIHKSKRIITISNFVKEDILRFSHTNPDKIVVIYPSADKIVDSPAPVDDLEGKQFILYVGRPLPHKNLERLVEAFSILRQSQPKLLLVLAGKYDERYQLLAHHVAEKQIPGVVFTGFVSDAGLRWLYEHAAAYVFPSLSEGFGLPGLEAMHYALPVVSSNATCLPEIYGDAAHYFDPLQPNDMAQKINEVLTDPALAGKLIDSGHALLRQYSWKEMAHQTLIEYGAVLHKSE